jgi:DNA-binding LacI/PurR family transcriptional regulator
MAERPAKTTATLATVADAVGVSRQTVSNALNAPEKVRPETLARIEAEIERQGYRPNNSARNLRIQRSCLLGYCMARPAGGLNPVMDRFIHAITGAAEQRGHHVLLFTEAGEPMATYQELFAHRVVDGFVISDTEVDDPRHGWFTELGVPFAAFGRRFETELGSWVDVDGAAGTALAVDHVAGAGHERIAYVGWPEGSGTGDDRRAGWRTACAARGLDTSLLRTSIDGVEPGRVLSASLLDLAHPPTAIVCASDAFAIGALQAVRERGLAPGRDVAVVGFDDAPAAALPGIGLTSVRQPIDEAGEVVVQLVTDRLADPARSADGVLLTPTLVVRASSSR